MGPGPPLGSVHTVNRVTRSIAGTLAGVLLVAASACGGDSDAAGDTAGEDAAATTTTLAADASTTEAPPSEAPTTTALMPTAFPTPAAAGEALFDAWRSGDRAAAGALNLAPASELDKLFAAPALPTAKNRGCDDGEFGSASCFFGNDQGGVNVGLSTAPGGWSIVTIDPFA